MTWLELHMRVPHVCTLGCKLPPTDHLLIENPELAHASAWLHKELGTLTGTFPTAHLPHLLVDYLKEVKQ